MPFIVETDHHTIDFTDKKAYKAVTKHCKDLGVNLDYYFFEFDTTDTEPENYDWDLMSDAWDEKVEDS